jgi:HSP20 family protein
MEKREIASRLKRFREHSNVTQGELADLLGISRQSVISLESSKCVPSVALALRIARLFDMPVEFIFNVEENQLEQKEKSKIGENMPRDLTPWSPLREIMSMRESLDRFFDEPTKIGSMAFHPSVGIRETEKELIIEVDLPGVKEEDVDVEIENDKVILKGERKHETETKREDYYHLESSYGSFSRMISLPSYVDASKGEAVFKNGVLEVAIPKVEEKKSKKLKIKKSEEK